MSSLVEVETSNVSKYSWMAQQHRRRGATPKKLLALFSHSLCYFSTSKATLESCVVNIESMSEGRQFDLSDFSIRLSRLEDEWWSKWDGIINQSRWKVWERKRAEERQCDIRCWLKWHTIKWENGLLVILLRYADTADSERREFKINFARDFDTFSIIW